MYQLPAGQSRTPNLVNLETSDGLGFGKILCGKKLKPKKKSNITHSGQRQTQSTPDKRYVQVTEGPRRVTLHMNGHVPFRAAAGCRWNVSAGFCWVGCSRFKGEPQNPRGTRARRRHHHQRFSEAVTVAASVRNAVKEKDEMLS